VYVCVPVTGIANIVSPQSVVPLTSLSLSLFLVDITVFASVLLHTLHTLLVPTLYTYVYLVFLCSLVFVGVLEQWHRLGPTLTLMVPSLSLWVRHVCRGVVVCVMWCDRRERETETDALRERERESERTRESDSSYTVHVTLYLSLSVL
jgi:hypothetical protein